MNSQRRIPGDPQDVKLGITIVSGSLLENTICSDFFITVKHILSSDMDLTQFPMYFLFFQIQF